MFTVPNKQLLKLKVFSFAEMITETNLSEKRLFLLAFMCFWLLDDKVSDCVYFRQTAKKKSYFSLCSSQIFLGFLFFSFSCFFFIPLPTAV